MVVFQFARPTTYIRTSSLPLRFYPEVSAFVDKGTIAGFDTRVGTYVFDSMVPSELFPGCPV